MYKHLLLTTAICLSVLLLNGCASIVSKSAYPVTISSNPNNVDVTITNRSGMVMYEGTTPASLFLDAKSGYFSKAIYMVKLSQYGYKTQTFYIEATLDGWYFGNLVFGGLIGMLIVDPLTGAMWKLPSSHFTYSLREDDHASNKGLKIMTLDEVPLELRDKLIPISQGENN